ncbi:MAG: cell division protein FtsA [Sphingobacteriales bacterium SCN 48-20]|jgi:cell division protein FtsA|uniref:cell division protein FtsA n=1 Tax=Terrimonas ferruginea TaxID=249 RepID=UPI000406D847|nr:cell division protein FtsA [Terrimonas ferruginea]MBN8783348.1 cell division protein FtsA [Terrimonas ferruginea]ODT95182.1 MAG: cell division protein FtsA [Sphingobacteriales bacterium SCN 48-20]OJW39963.1 MAG: cell division protein FtsA [Sphingobacteriales bacterium 48-107]
MSTEQPIIVGLDIGTTKIAVIAGRKNEYGKLDILGFGKSNSNGVKHGQVLNIDETIKAIRAALDNCFASNPNLEINEVYVGIAGHHIKSLQTRGDLVRQSNDEEITQKEIDQLISDQYKTYIPAGDQIIDVIPQEYTVDNFQNIVKPIGYGGVKLGANFHIITGDKNAIRNINRSVEKSGLHTKDLVLQPLASSSAVMAQEDLEAGVAIVDIGGGTTDLAVFAEGVLRHTAVIPFAGENITNDIKTGLGVLKTQAEQMKTQFGSALANEAKANAYITIPGLRGMPAKEISVKNLANIIQARMSEILDFVTYHLKQVGMDNRQLNGGIVLTGGGSQLRHLIQLTEYTTGLPARIGFPNEHLAAGHIEELAKPTYSTCIGLILKGYDDYEHNRKEFEKDFRKVDVPETLRQQTEMMPMEEEFEEQIGEGEMKKRKNLTGFWGKFKDRIIDLFKEEEDQHL